MNLPIDCHMHSTFSIDGSDTVDTMCRTAIEKGLKHITFTEHLEEGPTQKGYHYFKPELYTETLQRAKELYQNELEVHIGIEISEPYHYPKSIEIAKDFDLRLGSLHNIGGIFVGNPELLRRHTFEKYYNLYYEAMLEMVEFGGFHVLSHMDFPKRYFEQSLYPTSLIKQIFSSMKKNNIILEINTSPIRRGISACCPDDELLVYYAEAGISNVTVGSDAHNAADMADGYRRAEELIEKYRLRPGYFRAGVFYPL